MLQNGLDVSKKVLAINTDERTLVFHSFRHSFITELSNLDNLKEHDKKDLTGHKREGTTEAVYTKGSNIDAHKAIIDRLELDNWLEGISDWKTFSTV